MRLTDILRLPKGAESLAIIKTFLEQPRSHIEYQAAFRLYFEIANSLFLYDLVYEEGMLLLNELENQKETEHLEPLFAALFIACLKLEHFDDAQMLLDRRREILPVLKQYIVLLDEIQYKKMLHMPYLEDLERLLKEQIPDTVRRKVLLEIFDIYDKEQHHAMALNILNQLERYDLDAELRSKELELLMKLDRIDEAMQKAFDMRRKYPNEPSAVYAILSIYFKRGDYHKASMAEADFESFIDDQDDDFKLKVYPIIIDLYTKLDHKPSLNVYKRKLRDVQKRLEKKPKEEPVQPKEQDVVIVEKVVTKTKFAHASLKHFELAYDYLNHMQTLDESLPLRDYFRSFFMHIQNTLPFFECVIYAKEQSPNFFHYKKERLYDKIISADQIEHTYVEHVIGAQTEIVEEVSALKWQKNVITKENFTDNIKFIYAFPLKETGVFSMHFDEEITDPGSYYDLIKLIAAMVDGKLIIEDKMLRIKRDRAFYQRVLNSPVFYYRELTPVNSSYNDEAMRLFNVDRHHHIELFLKDVSYEHVNRYKETIQALFNRVGEHRELTYRYQDKYIYEKMYSLKKGDEVVIMSVFHDQTENVEETKELIEKATLDGSSGLANQHALEFELAHELKDKASLILIELEHDLKQIYGSERTASYFREFAQQTKKFFSDGKTYRTDYRALLVIIPINDIRSVTKYVKDYSRFLEVYTSSVLKYEKFKVNMGILRYPVVTTEKTLSKLLRFLNIALDKAKRDREDTFAFFVYSDYENELFEQQIIDQMNVAIEEKSLALIFNQITDIKRNRVWQYESELIMPNLSIDGKYLIQVAKKRNRLMDLERYHLTRVFEFLATLEKETERLIKVTIPISKETFLDPTFNPFVLGLFKSYGIPYEFIRLKFDMELRPNHYAPQIMELIDHSIALDTTSLEMALNYPFHALHLDLRKDSEKWRQFILKVKELLTSYQMACVIRGVKSKDQKENLESMGIQYIEGSIYKEISEATLTQKIKESL